LWQDTQTGPITTGAAALEERARHLDHRRAGLGPQGRERAALEGVEVVRLAAAERHVRHEAVLDRAVLGADALAELDRQGRRDRDRAGDVPVVVRRRDGAVRLQHAPDHVAAVEGAHLVDDPADLARLAAQHPLRQAGEVEPHGGRQGDEPERHGARQKRTYGALLARDPLAQTGHLRFRPLVPAPFYVICRRVARRQDL
jgi:hypothetical protein